MIFIKKKYLQPSVEWTLLWDKMTEIWNGNKFLWVSHTK